MDIEPRRSITSITEIIKNSFRALTDRVKRLGRSSHIYNRSVSVKAPLVGVPAGQTVTELNKSQNQNIISTVSFTPRNQ